MPHSFGPTLRRQCQVPLLRCLPRAPCLADFINSPLASANSLTTTIHRYSLMIGVSLRKLRYHAGCTNTCGIFWNKINPKSAWAFSGSWMSGGCILMTPSSEDPSSPCFHKPDLPHPKIALLAFYPDTNHLNGIVTETIRNHFPYFALSSVMWLKQCHKQSPSHHQFYI